MPIWNVATSPVVSGSSRRSRRYQSPRDKVLAVFDQLGDLRGCPFIRAGADAPSRSPVEEANDAYRRWVRSLFRRLARDAGASDPATLAVQLQILYDGSAVGARMDRNTRGAKKARMAAEVLVDAARRLEAQALAAEEGVYVGGELAVVLEEKAVGRVGVDGDPRVRQQPRQEV